MSKTTDYVIDSMNLKIEQLNQKLEHSNQLAKQAWLDKDTAAYISHSTKRESIQIQLDNLRYGDLKRLDDAIKGG